MKESPISPTSANGSLTSKDYFEANFLDGDPLQPGQLVSAVEVFRYIQEVAQKKYQEGELKGRIDELYSLITPIWGDKKWDEPDDYILNMKGRDILNHIKELEKQAVQSQLERKEQ